MPFVNRCGSQNINLQSKTAYPSSSAQTITPDEGYDGLSQVVISPTLVALTGTCTKEESSAAYADDSKLEITFTNNMVIPSEYPPSSIFLAVEGKPSTYFNNSGKVSNMNLRLSSLNPLKYNAIISIIGSDGLKSFSSDLIVINWVHSTKSLTISIPSSLQTQMRFAFSYNTELTTYSVVLVWGKILA